MQSRHDGVPVDPSRQEVAFMTDHGIAGSVEFAS
jgi:hypothetical protein